MAYRAQGAQVAQSSSLDATRAVPGLTGGPAEPTWAAGEQQREVGSWDPLLTPGKCGSSPHRERYLCAGDGGC